MIPVCLFFFILVTQLSTVNTEGCDSFKNTRVAGLRQIDSVYQDFLVNGCLEPEEFEGNEITETQIIGNISRLGKDSIRNMPKLEFILIYNEALEVLEPQAFRNLPSLKTIEITHTNLKEMPKNVFNLIPSITNLLMYRNKIDFIATGAFTSLESLREIDLSVNALTYWNREWFENCTNLQSINFNNNKISMIPRRAFATLPSLDSILLEGNEITTIQARAFENLKNLRYLNLAHNRLSVIDDQAFPNNIHIDHMRIQGNYLNYLQNKFLKKLSVRDISLDYNPWKCPCLQRINDWLYFTGARLELLPNCKSPYAPICAVPQGNLLKCREHVDGELTRRYIGFLKNLKLPLGYHCARLD